MIRSLTLSIVLVILFFGSTPVFSAGIGQIPSSTVSHQIQAIIDSVSPTNIRAYLDTLVSFTFRHTVDDTTSLTTGIGAARRWVYSKFQEISAASGGRFVP
ncbi:MAG: family metallo-hydrolase, partial [Bacteroidetes bacterium]|nr:family metallo-hydrolase [Bacteroidota bacterium]